MDLTKVKDRKKIFAVMDDFYALVLKLGGTTCGEHNDGLLRAPYLEKVYGREMYDLFKDVKRICDPKGIFNPRIKLDVTKKELEPLVRHEYSMKHLYDHLPHT
jgi:FAD/FMN-containing dehydrogenase